MAGAEATKKEREYGDPNNPGRGQAPEVQNEVQHNDPNKRNKPDQYNQGQDNQNQGGGLPPTEQATSKQGSQPNTGQTGHEDPRTAPGQQKSQNQPQSGQQQGNQGGQQGDRGRDNKTTSETDERTAKQGQKH
jgi:hypothetical protein